MKRFFLLASLSIIFAVCRAQTLDSNAVKAAKYFKETQAASKDQSIWPRQLYGPMLFVDVPTRKTWANMQDSAALLKPQGGIYTGLLPKEVMVANTAIGWGGRVWSVILWPLPDDHQERLNLILHESFHRIQNELKLPASNPTAAHLKTAKGRIYFLLELQALKRALGRPLDARYYPLTSALYFREKRHKLFPKTFNNERLLEMNEGLAEYTGVILGRSKDSVTSHLRSVIDHAAAKESLIRSSPYITGPVYGYLLYQKAPDWTTRIDSSSDFPALLSHYYGLPKMSSDFDNELLSLEQAYNTKEIIASEIKKEAVQQKINEQYLNRFTKNQVLSIHLQKLHISFDFNTMNDLGDYGTVYPTAEISDDWGHLNVTAGGVLIKDWATLYLPFTGTKVNGQQLTGNGWLLTINPNWKVVHTDQTHVSLARKE